MNKIIINASNLHSGGGVQVASSFIDELVNYNKEISNESNHYVVLCSDEVFSYLKKTINTSNNITIYNFNTYGIKKPNQDMYDICSGANVVFTIFGPVYHKLEKDAKDICGFAQAWIAYPANIAYSKLRLRDYIKAKIKYSIQWLFFKRSDILIVEQEHIKNALVNNLNYPIGNIKVANNSVSSRYFNIDFEYTKIAKKIKFGVMGRGYSHKNLDILIEVNDILTNKYKLDCEFLFTLSDDEFHQLNFSDIPNFKTCGILDFDGCVSFYSNINALIFTSLLECFSVTPLEAMATKTPVFASDYKFISSLCKEHVFYINPMSAKSIADKIIKTIRNEELLEKKVYNAYNYVKTLPTARDRARAYLDYIDGN
ncbi:TPA: glycosyltransferase family 4 protein [Photobacterium damselae]